VWTWPAGGAPPFAAPPVIVNNVVLAGCDDYNVSAVDFSNGSGEMEIPDKVVRRAAPAVSPDGLTAFVTSLDWTVSEAGRT